MDHIIAQFSDEELVIIRQLVGEIIHTGSADIRSVIAGFVNANYVVTNAGVNEFGLLAGHSVSFNTSGCVPYNFTEIRDEYVNKHRRHVLSTADKLKFLGQFINFTRETKSPKLETLECFQVNQLIAFDKLFPPVNCIRCITWISEALPGGAEKVIAPFLTCVPANNFHVMYYTVFNSANRRTIKVVVDNYLVDIPFELVIPPPLTSMTVVMLVNVILDATGTAIGANIAICHDAKFD